MLQLAAYRLRRGWFLVEAEVTMVTGLALELMMVLATSAKSHKLSVHTQTLWFKRLACL